ncbi:M48 family metallopeptidase [Chitinibacter sp. GC72]|uniref:M48 family metallopeptidase n=1 Tax=Chitinibacter sp. GC72 TaxID=1526917 RepID=UPI0012F8B41C|nr:M48 family metallopeptidase [Chitinibacter sp. GC72]
MTAHQFSILFLFALLTSVLLQLWLAMRHINHVLRHRKAVPSEFAGQISIEAHGRAAAYTIAKTRFGMFSTIFDAMLLAAFTVGGGIEWLSQLTAPWFDSDIAQGLALITGLAIVNTILSLPFSLISTFVIEARFGFNQMTPKLFIADFIKSTAIGAIIGLPLLAAILWLMARMGDNWWLYVWVTWLVFSLTLMWVFPTFIAPLFNKFVPLEDGVMKERIVALLQRCGFTSNGLFVMDGSKRSSHGNAYFTGLGKSKRIVFFDTLLKTLAPAEVEAVLAHELGHFKHRHIVKRMIWTFALMLGLLWVLGELKSQLWFYQGLGVSTPSTAAALLLFFLTLPVFTFIFAPISSITSRKHEYEADAFAASQCSAEDLITALVKLYRDNASTLTPDPLHSMFYDSHPPASLRIAALRRLNS